MTNTQVAEVQRPPIMVLRERFEARRTELKNSLPGDISVDAFIRAAMTGAQLNPEILGCTWQSIWDACLRACRDGLLPDGVEGAIVPYKSKASWIAMYQGQLRRFRRSGQFKWVTANVVRAGELFEHYIDENGEHIKHVPGDDINAPLERVYAMATTKDGGLFVAVLPIAEAQKMRAMSRTTRDDAPWKMWPEEMYKKTALRRLSKYLPSARDIIGDDDDEVPEVVSEDWKSSEKVIRDARPTGAAAALEQFAGAPAAAVAPDTTAVEEDGGATQTAPATDAVSAAPDRMEQASGGPTDPPLSNHEAVAITRAFRDGQDAIRAGVKRSTPPPAYKSPDRKRELEAWYAGYDGKSQLL